MGATNQNTMDSIASRSATTVFRVPPLPSLATEVSTSGLKEGLRRFDEKAARWTRDLEKEINERLIKAQAVSPGPPG